MNEEANNRDAVGPVPPPGVPLPPRGETVGLPANAATGDTAYNKPLAADVGRLPSAGADAGRVPPHGAPRPPNAASGDAAYNTTRPADVGRVPSHGVPNPNEP